MPNEKAGHRLSPADLPPELRAKYEAVRAKAAADNQLGVHGPPLNPDPAGGPFGGELRACVAGLKAAREVAGLTLAEVAARTGLAEETISRLETGAATNPTWQTLGKYAAAVGCRLALAAEPAAGPRG
jgi:DNA-binding XRE family transcriptional regulator